MHLLPSQAVACGGVGKGAGSPGMYMQIYWTRLSDNANYASNQVSISAHYRSEFVVTNQILQAVQDAGIK